MTAWTHGPSSSPGLFDVEGSLSQPHPSHLPALSTCLSQVELYVWHMLPLGKDLLHRIPAVLQTGKCPVAAPGQQQQQQEEEAAAVMAAAATRALVHTCIPEGDSCCLLTCAIPQAVLETPQ